jgi:hypothetical protein
LEFKVSSRFGKHSESRLILALLGLTMNISALGRLHNTMR